MERPGIRNKIFTTFFAWGEQRIQQVIDPNGTHLTNTWDYYTNSGQNGYMYLKQMTTSTGYWETLRVRRQQPDYQQILLFS